MKPHMSKFNFICIGIFFLFNSYAEKECFMLTDEQKKAGQELVDAAAYDTQVRIELEKDGSLFTGYHPKMRAVHEENAQKVEKFIVRYGWPMPSIWGTELHEAAWFIAIHAISKPQLLRKTLVLLEQALKNGEPVQNEYARLFDRIALYEGRKQRYGTQFFNNANGRWYARDLENPEQVDERRAAIGNMPSFAENQKEVDEYAKALPVQPPPMDEEFFLRFLREVGWQ